MERKLFNSTVFQTKMIGFDIYPVYTFTLILIQNIFHKLKNNKKNNTLSELNFIDNSLFL